MAKSEHEKNGIYQIWAESMEFVQHNGGKLGHDYQLGYSFCLEIFGSTKKGNYSTLRVFKIDKNDEPSLSLPTIPNYDEEDDKAIGFYTESNDDDNEGVIADVFFEGEKFHDLLKIIELASKKNDISFVFSLGEVETGEGKKKIVKDLNINSTFYEKN